MKAVFLVIDYVPHQVTSIKNLIEREGADVLAFHVGRFYKDIPRDLKNFTTYNYKSFTKRDIIDIIIKFSPDLLVTAGWMIPEYVSICKSLKKQLNFPIVAYSDTPWYGTWKQKLNAFVSPYHIKRAFTHLWVAGVRQYDYARKLGFDNENILFNSLSANTSVFSKVDIMAKEISYPKNFLYVGKYSEIKGLRNLMDAWLEIKNKKGWTFTVVGDGEMRNDLMSNGNFIIKDYMNQSLLSEEMQNAGCFVLASSHEQWGLVLHEAASAGLPIICTETCGASSQFVINNYNGYRVKNFSVEDLKSKLEIIINSSNTRLINFSNKSRELSKTISPDIQIASLMQILRR